MRHERFALSALERVALLNERFAAHPARAMLDGALRAEELGRTALVSSFGAESVVLLHMVARVAPNTPVLFLDTEMLFAETLEYQLHLTEAFGLTDVRRITPSAAALSAEDPFSDLHMRDQDGCCDLRKVRPLEAALSSFDAWITGRKRHQTAARADLDLFEEEDGTGRIKLNPLAHWRREDVLEYIAENNLPRHPLIAQGFPSIGCAPCTSRVAPGEDPRAGRWRGSAKDECGIHFIRGRALRPGASVIVRDDGFHHDDWEGGFAPEAAEGVALDLAPDADPLAVRPDFEKLELIRIPFGSFSDGRGFTLAARLRRAGYRGRLRAKGGIIADQYTAARRAGFDEVEIDAELALRQDESQWLARAKWQANDHRARLRAKCRTAAPQ